MKALTLWQPWASAIAAGLKRVETRGWSTAYRGRMAIHAAKCTPSEHLTFFDSISDRDRAAFGALGIRSRAELPTGCIVAFADLYACVKMDEPLLSITTEEEQRWGIWTLGRYGLYLRNIETLRQPIPVVRGWQKMWEWDGIVPGNNQAA